MSEDNLYMSALEISRLFGVNDRTVSRWGLTEEIEKKGRGKYSVLSVFNRYREHLKEKVDRLNDKVASRIYNNTKKTLQQDKLEASIKVIETDIDYRAYELKKLEDSVVERQEADLAYKETCERLGDIACDFPEDTFPLLAEMDDPHQIKDFLEDKIHQMLVTMRG